MVLDALSFAYSAGVESLILELIGSLVKSIEDEEESLPAQHTSIYIHSMVWVFCITFSAGVGIWEHLQARFCCILVLGLDAWHGMAAVFSNSLSLE
jgi:hypothetical protein